MPEKTTILVTPIEQIGIEENLSREKLCPVLAYHVAKNRDQAISQARAVLRLTGAGHSAAVHTMDETVTMAFARTLEVYRIVVNAPCSQGAAGFGTALAPTFTIGTGYFGRSSIGENVGPEHLVHWTKLAYNEDASEKFGDYLCIGNDFSGPLPSAPEDGVPGAGHYHFVPSSLSMKSDPVSSITRTELRQMIAEELRGVLRG